MIRSARLICATAVLGVVVTGYASTVLTTRACLAVIAYAMALSAAIRWTPMGLAGAMAVYVLADTVSVGFLDIRLAAIPFVVILATRARSKTQYAPATRRILACFFGLTALAGASIVWSDDRATTVNALIGLSAVFAIWWVSIRAMKPEDVLSTLSWFLGAVLVLSAAIVLVGGGQLGGRARGLFGNPNGLGLCILLSLPVILARSGRRAVWLVGLLSLLIRTASRAAVAGILCEIMILAAPKRTGLRKALVLGSVGAVAIAVGWLLLNGPATVDVTRQQDQNSSIRRRTDSRSAQWTVAVEQIRAHLPLGTGMGAGTIDTASSYLKLGLEGGLVGSSLGVLTLLSAGRATSRMDKWGAAFVAGGLANALFESWLFVGGSFFCLTYWLTVAAYAQRTQLVQEKDDGLAAVHA